MKRRSVLGGLSALAGTSLAGCLGGNGENSGETSASPPWFRKVTMDVGEEGNQGRVVIHVSKKADLTEMSLYKPDGSLQTTAVVGSDQRRVGLAQVAVSTRPVSFTGLQPGTYKVEAKVGGEKTDKVPFDLVREFVLENLSLAYGSSSGSDWVSGFQATVSNDGLYPFILDSFGPVDGVVNPPAEGEPGDAEPVAEDGDTVLWWEQAKEFVEQRREGPGPLVKPKSKGTPADGELSGEFTATLKFVTTKDTHEIPVTYRLDGDLVTTENGYAMSSGEIVSIDGTTPTGTGSPTATGDE
jgi:hypothetical protein